MMPQVLPLDYSFAEIRVLTVPFPLPASTLPEFNEAALSELLLMGFPEIRCQKALLATGNSDSSAAMEWLFNHMDDAGSSSFVFFTNILS
jgi:uncharacterized UBP type Zn finger protein